MLSAPPTRDAAFSDVSEWLPLLRAASAPPVPLIPAAEVPARVFDAASRAALVAASGPIERAYYAARRADATGAASREGNSWTPHAVTQRVLAAAELADDVREQLASLATGIEDVLQGSRGGASDLFFVRLSTRSPKDCVRRPRCTEMTHDARRRPALGP